MYLTSRPCGDALIEHSLPLAASDVRVLFADGECINLAIACSSGNFAEIADRVRHSPPPYDGLRTYRECQTICGVQLSPVSQLARCSGSWLMHTDTARGPHCIAIVIDAYGECRLYDRNQVVCFVDFMLDEILLKHTSTRMPVFFKISKPCNTSSRTGYLEVLMLRAGMPESSLLDPQAEVWDRRIAKRTAAITAIKRRLSYEDVMVM